MWSKCACVRMTPRTRRCADERQGVSQAAGVERGLAVQQEGRQPVAGRRPAVRTEGPDRERCCRGHASRILAWNRKRNLHAGSGVCRVRMTGPM
mgnify:CR=1 FL=1